MSRFYSKHSLHFCNHQFIKKSKTLASWLLSVAKNSVYLASLTGYGGVFLPLYVEYLAPETSGDPDFSKLVIIIRAFGASIDHLIHHIHLSFALY